MVWGDWCLARCVGALTWVGHRTVSFGTGVPGFCWVGHGGEAVGRVAGVGGGEGRGEVPWGRVLFVGCGV